MRFIFFPQIEGNDISASVTMPDGTPFSRTDAAVRRMVEAVSALRSSAWTKPASNCSCPSPPPAAARQQRRRPGWSEQLHLNQNAGQIRIELMPYGERQTTAAEIERMWRREVGTIEGAERVTYASSFASFGSDIAFELAHEDEAKLIAAADLMKARLAEVPSVNQIDDSFDLGKRQLTVELTPAGVAAGLLPADVAQQVRQGFFGEEVQRSQRGREEVKVYVRYPQDARERLEALEDFRVQLPGGGRAPLFRSRASKRAEPILPSGASTAAAW